MARIPKKIHYCWLSGDPFPELIQHCIESWRRFLPDYELVLWDTRRINIQSVPWIREAVEARKYAFAADYIRLYAVYTEGGIYLDADVEVFKSFDALLDQPSFIGYETSGDLEPAVFGAEKGCEWIAACLSHYRGRNFVKSDGSRDMTPLPIVVESKLRDLGLFLPRAPRNTPVHKDGVSFYPAEFFSPKDVHTKAIEATAATYSVHHFDGQWVDQTLLHRCKQAIHRGLRVALGPVAHRRIVELMRRGTK